MNLYYSEKWKGTNLTVLWVVGLVFTIITIILGIFLYPMLAYIMNSGETMFYLGLVLMIISFIILIVSIIKAIHYAKKQPNDYKKRKAVFCSPIVIISFFLFTILFSNFNIYGSKIGDHYVIRWGNCLYDNSYKKNKVYSMFGITKMEKGDIYPVYLNDGEKGFLKIPPSYEIRMHEIYASEYRTTLYFQLSFIAKIYDSNGNIIESYDISENILCKKDDYGGWFWKWNDITYSDERVRENATKDMAFKTIGCTPK
ncbi:MAG: hypothetical protein SPK52_02365 [Synergistales bacterium]|nr:hypothetical protein [Bacteroidales bacterium]MDY6394545.1 hypothetical protein [Bacteroidales bacterium]MDY6402728.1 hypothetical protein [Bacteroidales bacterium]MDY6424116.1 hypothetical protein [Bacteroidales bacterium]MDY6435037.1 hypothetical protein [Synergistales bacterium]